MLSNRQFFSSISIIAVVFQLFVFSASESALDLVYAHTNQDDLQEETFDERSYYFENETESTARDYYFDFDDEVSSFDHTNIDQEHNSGTSSAAYFNDKVRIYNNTLDNDQDSSVKDDNHLEMIDAQGLRDTADRQSNEFMGSSVASAGNTLVVGAKGEKHGSGTSYGGAHVYEWNGTDWDFVQTLAASDQESGDEFGYAVAISDDESTIVVGAPNEDPGGTGNAGAVYVFEESGGVWSEVKKMQATTPEGGAEMGFSVDIDATADTIIAGAPYYFDSTGVSRPQCVAGLVYIFDKAGGLWPGFETDSLCSSDAATNDRFGWDAVIGSDGTEVWVGAPEDDDTDTSSGTAYLFTKSGTWSQTEKIEANTLTASDFFGRALAYDQDESTVVVCAEAGNGINVQSGACWVFEDSTGYSQTAHLTGNSNLVGSSDKFGFSVDIQENMIAVGASEDEAGVPATTGVIYLFEKTGGFWDTTNPIGLYLPWVRAHVAGSEKLGTSVVINNEHVVGGAENESFGVYYTSSGPNTTSNGAAYAFRRDTSTSQFLRTWDLSTNYQWDTLSGGFSNEVTGLEEISVSLYATDKTTLLAGPFTSTALTTGVDISSVTQDFIPQITFNNQAFSDTDYYEYWEVPHLEYLSATAQDFYLTSPSSYQIYQRDTGTNDAVVTFTCAFDESNYGSPGAFQVNYNGSTWEDVDPTPTIDGCSGTLTISTEIYETVEARLENYPGTTDSISNFAVGDVFIVAGDDYHVGGGDNNQTYSNFLYKLHAFTPDQEWGDAADPLDDPTNQVNAALTDIAPVGGNALMKVGENLLTNQFIPIGFIMAPKAGVTASDMAKSGAIYTAIDDMVTAASIGPNPIRGVLLSLGRADAEALTDVSTFKTTVSQLASDFDTDFGAKTVLSNIYGVSANESSLIDYRLAIQDLWDTDVNIFAGAQTYDFDFDADLDFATDSNMSDYGFRMANGVGIAFYAGFGGGPSITAAEFADGGSDITLTFDNFLSSSSISAGMFDVTVNGFDEPVLTVSSENSNVTLSTGDTFSSGDTIVVTYAGDHVHGLDPIVDAFNELAPSFQITATTLNLTPPQLTSFTSTSLDGTYGPGSNINITANYDEDVDTGSITVVLDNGESVTLSNILNSTISGTYTVGSTGSGEDSSDLTIASISSQSVFDSDSNENTSTSVPTSPNNLADSSAIVVDTSGPTATISTLEPTPTSSDSIGFTVTFGETVSNVDLSDFALETTGTVTAALDSIAPVLVGTEYLVTVDTIAGDGNLNINFDSGQDIEDTYSNAFNGTASSNVVRVIDNTAPDLDSFNSETANGTYGVGQTINIKANYDDTLNSSSTLTVVLNTGATVTLNNVVSNTISGTYTVSSLESTSDLTVDTILSENVFDQVLNTQSSSSVPSSNIGTNKDIVIDTSAPSLVSFTSSTNDGTYGTGENVIISANFNRNLDGNSSIMTVFLDTGATVNLTTVASAKISGTYTIAEGQSSSDLNVSGIVTTSITDTLGNSLSSASLPSSPNNLADSSDIVIDTTVAEVEEEESGGGGGSIGSFAIKNVVTSTSSESTTESFEDASEQEATVDSSGNIVEDPKTTLSPAPKSIADLIKAAQQAEIEEVEEVLEEIEDIQEEKEFLENNTASDGSGGRVDINKIGGPKVTVKSAKNLLVRPDTATVEQVKAFVDECDKIFSDAGSHRYLLAMKHQMCDNIIHGPDNNLVEFQPDASLKRVEWVKMVARSSERAKITREIIEREGIVLAAVPDDELYEVIEEIDTKFNEEINSKLTAVIEGADTNLVKYADTDTDDWYSPYIAIGIDNGWLNGERETFDPDKTVSVSEAAKTLAVAYGLDIEVHDEALWYEPYVKIMSAWNMIPPDIDTASHKMTRGEAAEMLERMRLNMRKLPSSRVLN